MSSLKILLVFISIALPIGILSAQETKTLKGRIISEDFELLPGIKIHDKDTSFLGYSDRDGYFEFKVPVSTSELLLGFIGMEWTTVKIVNNCDNIEIFMMSDVIYDFIPAKRIDKKRYKRFKKLPKKHSEAHKKGIFKSKAPCVSYTFTK